MEFIVALVADSNPLPATLIKASDQLGWISGDYTERRKTLRHHAICPHHAIPPDHYFAPAAGDHASMTQPAILFDHDSPTFAATLGVNREIGIRIFVIVVHDQNRRCQQYVFAKLNVIFRRNRRPPPDLATRSEHDLCPFGRRFENDIQPRIASDKDVVAQRNVL